jgi:hypothetical protein
MPTLDQQSFETQDSGAVTDQQIDHSGVERLVERCLELGLTQELANQLAASGEPTAETERGAVAQLFWRLSGLGRGPRLGLGRESDYQPTRAVVSAELRTLRLAVVLYDACTSGESFAPRLSALMQELSAELTLLNGVMTPAGRCARGYAGLCLGDALLRMGDVGAARSQLELVADEAHMPPAIAVIARLLLGAIEQACGRSDLALGHLQVALHRAAGLGQEEQLLRLILVGVLAADNRRYALAMLDDIAAGKYGQVPSGEGTVARLYQLLLLLGQGAARSLESLALMRAQLRWLQHRHGSAGWSLLLTGLTAGMLLGAEESCDAYDVLVQSAAELRCRYLDGVADLCDRQISTLRTQLGLERFESLLGEAQRRRKTLLALQREQSLPGVMVAAADAEALATS